MQQYLDLLNVTIEEVLPYGGIRQAHPDDVSPAVKSWQIDMMFVASVVAVRSASVGSSDASSGSPTTGRKTGSSRSIRPLAPPTRIWAPSPPCSKAARRP